MPSIEALLEDGLEHLGTFELSGQLWLGEPAEQITGGGQPLSVRPGRWHLLGRAYAADPDLLEEVVAIHEPALERFYALYDSARERASRAAGGGRVALLVPGALDPATLLELVKMDREALPWILDEGAVFATIADYPVTLMAPPGPVAALLSILLAPPVQLAASSPSEFSSGEDDDRIRLEVDDL